MLSKMNSVMAVWLLVQVILMINDDDNDDDGVDDVDSDWSIIYDA